MKETIDLMKKAKNVNASEELFGINKQPIENCPYIDECIRDLKTTYRNVISEIYSADIEDSVKKDIKWYAEEIENYADNFDELRSRIEDLRDWGEQWKTLAKQMFIDLPKEEQDKYIF